MKAMQSFLTSVKERRYYLVDVRKELVAYMWCSWYFVTKKELENCTNETDWAACRSKKAAACTNRKGGDWQAEQTMRLIFKERKKMMWKRPCICWFCCCRYLQLARSRCRVNRFASFIHRNVHPASKWRAFLKNWWSSMRICRWPWRISTRIPRLGRPPVNRRGFRSGGSSYVYWRSDLCGIQSGGRWADLYSCL